MPIQAKSNSIKLERPWCTLHNRLTKLGDWAYATCLGAWSWSRWICLFNLAGRPKDALEESNRSANYNSISFSTLTDLRGWTYIVYLKAMYMNLRTQYRWCETGNNPTLGLGLGPGIWLNGRELPLRIPNSWWLDVIPRTVKSHMLGTMLYWQTSRLRLVWTY